MKITYKTTSGNRTKITGWRCFWGMTVTGFNPHHHCMKCLIGDRFWPVSMKTIANTEIDAPFPDGTTFYICGVASTWKWNDNFHLVVRAKAGARCEKQTWNGDIVTVEGAEVVSFTADDAAEQYPDKSAKFLTCRNFQFGATFEKSVPQARRVQRITQDRLF